MYSTFLCLYCIYCTVGLLQYFLFILPHNDFIIFLKIFSFLYVLASYLQFLFIVRTHALGPLANGLKYFRFWLRFCLVILISGSKKLTPGVSYCGESKNVILELFYKNAKWSPLLVEYQSTFIFVTLFLIKACAKVLRKGCWLPGVMRDSAQYDTRKDWLCAV